MTEAEQAGVVVEINPDLPVQQSNPSAGIPGISEPVINPVTLTNDQVREFADAYGEGYAEVLARQIIQEQQLDHPELDYDTLADGTNPIFDRIAEYADKPPAERALYTPSLVISSFATDPEGNPLSEGTLTDFAKGAAREAPSAIASAYAGFKTGQKVLQAGAGKMVPQVLYPAAAVAGLGSSVLTYLGVDLTRSYLAGPEDVMTPGALKNYEMGRTLMGNLAWLPYPFMTAVKPVTAAQDYVRKLLTDQVPVGPLTKDALSTLNKRGLEKTVKSIKGDQFVPVPRSAKMAAGLEKGLTSFGQTARTKPKTTLGVESLPIAGSTIGAGYAQESDPNDPATRIGYETVGAVAPTLLGATIVPKLVGLAPDIKQVYTNIRDKGFKQTGKELAEKIGGRRERKAIEQILEVLETYGEDIDEVIARLSSDDLSQVMYDESGKKIKLTAGAKSGSPGLLAVEAALEQINSKIGETRNEANRQALMALQNTIYALAISKDSDALQLAGQLAKEAFDESLKYKVDRAQRNLVQAYNKLIMGAPEEEARKRTRELSVKLFEVVGVQLDAARAKERQLWQAVPNTSLTQFADADGNVSDIPGFIARWSDLTAKGAIEFEQEALTEGGLRWIDNWVRRRARDYGFEFVDPLADGATDGAQAATRQAADAGPLSGLGKEKTKLYQPALNMMPDRGDDPSGFKVFQRKGEEGGFVTTVVDSMGNKVELRLDPSDRITPYTATIINGTGPDAFRAGATSSTVPLAGPNNVQEAVAMTRVRMSSEGDFNFAPTSTVDEVSGASDEVAQETAEVAAEGTERLRQFDVTARPKEGLTLQELQSARSSALARGRKLAASGDVDEARIVFEFADALLEDMNSISATEAGAAYNIARSYSRALNDTFTRSYAGEALKKSPSGAYRGAPELMWQKTGAGTEDATTLRLEQILDIPKFALANNVGKQRLSDPLTGAEISFDPKAAQASTEMAIESLLRDAHFSVGRNTDGSFNEGQFQKWMRQHEQILSQFPGLYRDLQNVERRAALLDGRRLSQKEQTAKVKSLITFMDLLPAGIYGEGTGVTNPAIAIERAMKDKKNRLPNMLRLLSYAENAPEKIRESALRGYKNAVIEWALTESGSSGGMINFKVLYNKLFVPPEIGVKEGVAPRFTVPLIDLLVQNKAMPQSEADRLRKFVTNGVKFEAGMSEGKDIAELTKKMNAGLAVWFKISGSAAGTRVYSLLTGGQGGPGSITAAGIGSKAVSDLVDRLPEALAGDVMHKIMTDPDLLALLLREYKPDSKEGIRIAGLLEAKLMDYGMIVPRRATRTIPREATRDEQDPTRSDPADLPISPLQLLPQRPQDRPAPSILPQYQPLSQARPAAPAPVAQAPAPPQGAANPQQRQQLAAMFPNDPILGAAGGIGTLFS